MKEYVPIGEFEQRTSYCPTYIAWRVLDEARDFFREPIPERYADELAQRAERVFAGNGFWRRRYLGACGAEDLMMTMRHRLASVLAKERPRLFRELPGHYKIGQALPPTRYSQKQLAKTGRAASNPLRRVHGAELLAV